MKISVVIPLYNKARYIKRTIDSVINQKISPNEIIIVDDGSTDGGGKIVTSEGYPIIRLVTKENGGESSARNRGVQEAKNKFIAFLDADDEWLPSYLENIQTLFNNFPDCGAYATSSYTIRPNGTIYYPDLSILPPEPWIGIIPNFFELFQKGMAFNSSSIVILKEILIEVGGFPENIKHTPDIDTWVRIAVRYPIAFSPRRLAVYHQDALDRTAPKNSDNIEYPVIKTIKNLIRDEIIPKGELRYEALEYITKNQINVAINNLLVGNRVKAIHLLDDCKYTKKYKKLWLYWRFWSFFPPIIPQMLLNIKGKLKIL